MSSTYKTEKTRPSSLSDLAQASGKVFVGAMQAAGRTGLGNRRWDPVSGSWVCDRCSPQGQSPFSTPPHAFSARRRQLQARAQPVQPFQVVGQADQRPFQRHFLPPSQAKLPEPEHALEDPKHRFHGLLS